MNGLLAPASKILFVDDEPNILEGFQRQFRKRFAVETAVGSQKGLELVSTQGPYAVIVSDLRMPGMDGVEFLSQVKNRSPETARIMLTGQADMAAAISAVNEGNIFRFLQKPCVYEVLSKTLDAAMEQHRLVTAERILLEHTLRGAVEVLTEMLSLASPDVFSKAARVREYVRQLAAILNCSNTWEFEVAAMLSHIGCITVPPAIISKVDAAQSLSEAERRIFDAHPQVGQSLLARIPRLEAVASMVARQQEVCRDPYELVGPDQILLGARMLKAVLDLDLLKMAGVPLSEAVARMRAQGGYNLRVLNALDELITRPEVGKELRDLSVRDLEPGMTVDQDVMARNGLLLLARGQELGLK